MSEKLTETFRQDVVHSVSEAMTYSYDVTDKTTCTPKEGTEGVGLFQ